eukprot:TRINITY_DN9853_c0_g1_i1.p1 TRINITY_DN9853_c0_g1~~TRINITY_DN9853_c0_g1_i1.p1  ORF type:complete len:657 (-),score=145.65 TRINITY_DN9853_c0_g1_i1:117-2087(-)
MSRPASVELLKIKDDQPKLPPPTLAEMFIFAFPAFPGAMGAAFYNVNVFYYFTNTIGASLNSLNLAYSFDMIFVVLLFPIFGWLLDNTDTRWGRRKPWLLCCTPLLFLSYMVFWFPPSISSLTSDQQSTLDTVWYGIWNCLIVISTFLVSTPYCSLGVEITPHYIERSRLFGLVQAFSMLGWLIGVGAPPMLVGAFNPTSGNAPEHLVKMIYFIFSAVICSVGIVSFSMMLYVIKEPTDVSITSGPSIPIAAGIRFALFYNRPFQLVLIAITLINATPYFMSLLPYWVNSTLGLSSMWEGVLLITTILLGFICLPAWYLLTARTNKIVAFQTMLLLGGIAFLLMIVPGTMLGGMNSVTTKVLAALICSFYGSTGLSMTYNNFLYLSIQGDAIDYDHLLTGLRRESQYTNIMQFFNWLASVFNITLPFDILSILHYNSTNSTGVVVQTEGCRTGIAILIGPTAGLMVLACMIAMYFYPITQQVYDGIIENIQKNQKGLTVFDPIMEKWIPPHFELCPAEIMPPGLEDLIDRDLVDSDVNTTLLSEQPLEKQERFETRWQLYHFSRWELAYTMKYGFNFLVQVNVAFILMTICSLILVLLLWAFWTPFADYAPYCLIVVVFYFFYFGSAIVAAWRLKSRQIPVDEIDQHLHFYKEKQL